MSWFDRKVLGPKRIELICVIQAILLVSGTKSLILTILWYPSYHNILIGPKGCTQGICFFIIATFLFWKKLFYDSLKQYCGLHIYIVHNIGNQKIANRSFWGSISTYEKPANRILVIRNDISVITSGRLCVWKCVNIVILIVFQPSAVKKRFNTVRKCMRHYSSWGRIYIIICIHKSPPISYPIVRIVEETAHIITTPH